MAQKESGEYFFMNIIKNLFMPSAAGATTIARRPSCTAADGRTDRRAEQQAGSIIITRPATCTVMLPRAPPLLLWLCLMSFVSGRAPLAPTGPAVILNTDPVQNWTTYALSSFPEAVCINGVPATLKAFVNPKPSSIWVINIGGISPQAPGWCVNLQNCLVFGQLNDTAPKIAPLPPPAPIGLEATLLGSNCTQNPDFCDANKADLTMCDNSLGLGDAVHSGVFSLPCLPHFHTAATATQPLPGYG